MDDVVIEDIDDGTVERLHARALRNGREVNGEVLEILQVAVAGEPANQIGFDPSLGKIDSSPQIELQKTSIANREINICNVGQ